MRPEDFMEWKAWCAEQHANVNQKYGKIHSYSFHLQAVYSQVMNYGHLLEGRELLVARVAAWGHDILEDTNNNYNDLLDVMGSMNLNHVKRAAAEAIYRVTDEKGRNRAARKNEKYYSELCEDDVALFVKLCDLTANTLYSKLTGSSMYDKYKKEYPKFMGETYKNRFKEMYDYLESI